MYIIRKGNLNAKGLQLKKFDCEVCGCQWSASKGEYEEDWTKHSIPAYCKCPYCGTEIYAKGTFKNENHSHIRK